MDYNSFPDQLSGVTEKGFIPRIVRDDEHLQLYKKYYFPELDQKVKCIGIEEIQNVEYYYLANDSYQYAMTYPINAKCFIFTKDKYDIMSRHIINSDQVYRGYQLKWWFHKHKYYKYKNFIPLLNKVCDDDIYKVFGKLEHDRYVDCKIVLKHRRRDHDIDE